MKKNKFNHVFVLTADESGSAIFANACKYISNYSCGFETNISKTGTARVNYIKGNIEIDNRLSWFLGRLDKTYGNDAYYVHLIQDTETTAKNLNTKWKLKHSVARAFNHHILMKNNADPNITNDLVETINENIFLYLKDKKHKITINIKDPKEAFSSFIEAIDAEGDIDSAIQELLLSQNTLVNDANLQSLNENIKDEQTILDQKIDELSNIKKRYQNLKTKFGIVKRERKHYKKKYKRALRNMYITGAPFFILFSPIILPLMLQKKRKKKRTLAEDNLINNAFYILHSEGIDKALTFLELKEKEAPMGCKELFKSISTETDSEWLECFNQYMSLNNLQTVSLLNGENDRFLRIRFDRQKKIQHENKITVIMPAYNSEKTIESAIYSILNQSWQNLELIIIDDCSTDNTPSIIKKFASLDDRIVYLKNPINTGPYVSKNRALKIATGDYITGHDADDIALSDRLKTQMDPILSDDKVTGTISHMLRVDKHGKFSFPSTIGRASHDGIVRLAMISLLLPRKILIESLGFWDTARFGADSEMIARVQKFLGERLFSLKTITMLCLDHEFSLTNHNEFGINTESGLSPVRIKYRDNWRKWHNSSRTTLYVPFPHQGSKRLFEVPDDMSVAENALVPEDFQIAK